MLLRGILSFLLLRVVCQAQDLPLSQATRETSSLCEKDAGSWGAVFSEERLDAWICSLIGSLMVGLSGVLPVLFVPLKTGAALKSEGRPVLQQSILVRMHSYHLCLFSPVGEYERWHVCLKQQLECYLWPCTAPSLKCGNNLFCRFAK